jgi:hypothetical protein
MESVASVRQLDAEEAQMENRSPEEIQLMDDTGCTIFAAKEAMKRFRFVGAAADWVQNEWDAYLIAHPGAGVVWVAPTSIVIEVAGRVEVHETNEDDSDGHMVHAGHARHGEEGHKNYWDSRAKMVALCECDKGTYGLWCMSVIATGTVLGAYIMYLIQTLS